VKKALKILFVAILVVVLGGGAAFWAMSRSRHAEPAEAALAALASDAEVSVEQGEYLVYRPLRQPVRLGVVFYPGASCDLRGYAPVLRRLAARGYLVVSVEMPLEYAFLAPNSALDVPPAFPEVRRWAIIGHSLGGAMAGQFVHSHPDAMAGVIIWDSFPPPNASLADWPGPVWHIHRATLDGKPPDHFASNRSSYPASARWVPIRGGIHMYFGAFEGGGYKEQWAPRITREEQHDLAVSATLEALDTIAATG
jgi:hypothetical protein